MDSKRKNIYVCGSYRTKLTLKFCSGLTIRTFPILVLGAPKFKLEQPVQVLEQVVQGMSVFLLTTNMRLFLNPIINHISSPILICKIPSSKVISYIICEIYKLLPPILICEKY